MNKARRKWIDSITDKLLEIQADLEDCRSEEEEAYDNMPESFQYGEKGEAMQDAIDTMENADSSIQDAIDYLYELIGD